LQSWTDLMQPNCSSLFFVFFPLVSYNHPLEMTVLLVSELIGSF
jgi:hypothetical protein